MGVATLGFPGNTLAFRIDPDAVAWTFKVNTSVQETVGGRVVQILGATLSDITVNGSLGEDHSKKGGVGDGQGSSPGRSWQMAEAFAARVYEMIEYQSQQPNFNKVNYAGSQVNPPLRFTYAPYDWDFSVYVKSLSDPDGGVIHHTVGKFSYKYALTLFVLEENAASLGVLRGQAAAAADRFVERIAHGVGWEQYDPNTKTFAESAYSGYTAGSSSEAVAAFTTLNNEYSSNASQDAAASTAASAASGGITGTNTAQQIAVVAKQAGFSNAFSVTDSLGNQAGSLTWAVAIALAESGGNASATNHNTNGSTDIGMWQINSVHWNAQLTEQTLKIPATNAGAAFSISGQGHNFNPWSSFSYDHHAVKFLAQAAQAVGS